MELVVRALPSTPDEGDAEIVEHKGIGHPDTICDAVAEAFARGLARHYRDRFGAILHFNVDKALLVGGASRPAFGGGEVVEPMRLMLAGRATCRVGSEVVPVEAIARDAADRWLRDHLHALDPERHVVHECLVRGGSVDLVGVFGANAGEAGARLANDTSIGAGYAPATRLERAVLAAAGRLRAMAGEDPAVGEDVKVMGFRCGARARLTVACAMIGRYLAARRDYAARREAIAAAVSRAASEAMGSEVDVEVNAADDLAAGRVYLTVTGTSAEAGDDGEVGRGNRVNGLITPYRPMSLEATAGKNPCTHVGKLYNVAAHRLAVALTERVPGVTAAECFLVSRIGGRIDDPSLVDVRLRTDGAGIERPRVEALVREVVAGVGGLALEIVAGKVALY
jgi:S-adenosylmethionine synthetase